MRPGIRCEFCPAPLDLAQQFAYLVETQTADNPAMLAAIRRLPHAGGRPLAVCRACQAAGRPPRPGRVPRVGQVLLVAALVFGLGFGTAGR